MTCASSELWDRGTDLLSVCLLCTPTPIQSITTVLGTWLSCWCLLFTASSPVVICVLFSRVQASVGSPGRRQEVFWRLLLCPHQRVPPGAVRPLRTVRAVSGDPARHGHHAQRPAGVVLLPRGSLHHAGPGQGHGAQLQQVTSGRREPGGACPIYLCWPSPSSPVAADWPLNAVND